MERAFNNVHSFTITSTKDLTEAKQKFDKYETLLHQIAISFGFSNDESCELVQQAFCRAHERYAKQENCYPLKVFLTKSLIHKCIFKISSQLFSQSNTACIFSFNAIYTGDSRLQKMPLSLRTVYLLNIRFKYNELEMAEILNTTTVQVKEKLQKALAFIKTH